jgi:hypothetical protein
VTKAEARDRFYARARLAGDPPVSMMAVPHTTEVPVKPYWVLKCDDGYYLSDDEYGVAFTLSRKDATRFASRAKARSRCRESPRVAATRSRGRAAWSLAIRRVTPGKSVSPLAAARNSQIRNALDALTSVERTAAAIRRCLEGPSPDFPQYTPDLLRAALALEHSAAAHHALAEVGK